MQIEHAMIVLVQILLLCRSIVLGFTCSSVGKESSAMQVTQVQFLDWEDPLEKEMATHSSVLASRTPWTEELGRPQSMESQELDVT